MKENFRVDIVMDGLYECVVDSRFIVISVKPLCNEFLYKNLKHLFDKFKRQAEFHLIGYVDPKPFLPEDIFDWFLFLNPSMKVLVEKFDCEL